MNLIDEMCNAAILKIQQYIEEQSQGLHTLTAEEFSKYREKLLLNLKNSQSN
jgi:hypothetical protein